MKSCHSFLLLLSVSVFQQCQGFPLESFFPNDGVKSSTPLTLAGFGTIPLPCGNANQLTPVINGNAALHNGTNQLSPNTYLAPFLVNPADLNSGDQYTIKIDSGLQPDDPVVQTLSENYTLYYPRRGDSFTATQVLTVNWELTNGDDNNLLTNIFQMVVATDNNRMFILYQYANGMMQWRSTDSEVALHICNSVWDFTPEGEALLNTAIVTDSNVKEPGKYAFLIEGGVVFPAIICREGCSEDNADCSVEDTCDCQDGWKGLTCTELDCHPECEVNGDCITDAFVCTCNDGWSGGNCTDPICTTSCVNGYCSMPDMCTCNTGWKGETCNDAKCHTNCEENGHCDIPYECICNAGWSGGNCTMPICHTCVNGDCFSPNNCICHPGWLDAGCDRANCSEACLINGMCIEPNVCSCIGNWTGVNCEEPICLTGCHSTYGFCEVPDECQCREPYMGELCDTTVAPPALSQTEIGLLAAGLIVFVIITAVVLATIILSIRLC